MTGWEFNVRPADIDENPLTGEAPPDYVLRLAENKARAAGSQGRPGELILTADTTVADGSLILGKPSNAGEAREMLRALRGREHKVYTAIGVYDPHSARLETDLCTARVRMRAYTDDEIENYIASGDPFDKAGAYAIQHVGFHPVEGIEGCYACVVGLPLCHVVRLLRRFGMQPLTDVTAGCPPELGMDAPCPVYAEILTGETPGTPGVSRSKE